MKRVTVASLVPGMVTYEDVYSYNNSLILPKGFVLTDEAITRLEFYSIISLRVEDEVVKPQEEPVKEEHHGEEWPYSKQVQSSDEFRNFKNHFEKNIVSLKENLNSVVTQNAPIKIQEMLNETVDLLKTCQTSTDAFNMLHNMRQYDDLTFTHSLNVGLICNVFAGWLNFSEEDKELATLCGLLHDIGKLTIPEDIIKKPTKLTDEEFRIMKTHPLEGFRILEDQDVDMHIKYAALMHHERCDGSGYPHHFNGSQIDKFAKIVAIADVYDAMTATRVYRGPLCPFNVIEIFEEEGLQRYETQYILTFLENIVLTYMHNHVRLNNGQVGQIVFINKNNLSRPMLALEDGFIDLSQRKDLRIESIL